MKTMELLWFCLLLPICLAQSDSVAESNERIRLDFEQRMREREQYRRDSERRIEEIKQREKLRRANEQSAVAREQAQQAQATADETNARLAELERKLLPSEREAGQRRATNEEFSMSPGAMELVREMQRADGEFRRQPAYTTPPPQTEAQSQTAPRYSSHAVRQLSDGSVNALINGASMRFASMEDYNRHKTALDEAESTKQRQVDYEVAVNAARDRAFKKYPVFSDDNSLERLALDAYVTRFLNNEANKPYFQDSNWPEKIADQFATTYKIGPTGRK